MYFSRPHIRRHIMFAFLSPWLIKKILIGRLRCF